MLASLEPLLIETESRHTLSVWQVAGCLWYFDHSFALAGASGDYCIAYGQRDLTWPISGVQIVVWQLVDIMLSPREVEVK